MKNRKLNILKYALLMVLVSSIFGCEKWIDTDLNIDPDAPAEVPMDLLIPSIQANMAYDLGGNDLVRTTNVWMQYFDGVDRQSYAENTFVHTPADVNNLWNSLYAVELADLMVLKAKAEEQNSPHYTGLANIHIAICMGAITDLWGDVPFSDAFKGTEGNISPMFDNQEQVYITIQDLLTEGIAKLESAENQVPLKGDMIFGNDTEKWIKLAYALKARFALNLSERKGKAAYDEAISYLNKGLAGNADNCKFGFGTSSTELGPITQFMEQRSGDIVMSSTFIEKLKANNDPRLPFYAIEDGNGGYTGSVQGSQTSNGVSLPGTFIDGKAGGASVATSVYFMSFAEQKFIEAESYFMATSVDKAKALAALQTAVAASVVEVTGDANTAWLDANINNLTEGDLSLEMILEHKYLAMFGHYQPYTDYRRTNYPVLNTVLGATGNMPRRYPYAQEEITYNANTPQASKNDHVWWDAN